MGIASELLHCFLPSHEAFLFMWFLAFVGALALFIIVQKWADLRLKTDCDAPRFFDRLKAMVMEKKVDEAAKLCEAAGARILPRILGAGLRKFLEEPLLAADAMGEEATHTAAGLERRLNYLVMFGNTSTLLGLLGTVFGLIVSFAAVGQHNVPAMEKSSLLAVGISTAMNSTLVGLTISVSCILAYSFLRSKADAALGEIDRYSVAMLNLLNPPEKDETQPASLVRRSREAEEIADTDVTPMLNLMVLLIPFLLTSSEFVKIGTLEIKLPAGQAVGTGTAAAVREETKLDLGVVITSKGFLILHALKPVTDDEVNKVSDRPPDIPLSGNEYDFASLNRELEAVKRKAMYETARSYSPAVSAEASLWELDELCRKNGWDGSSIFADYESVKIVAEEKVKYQTVVSVMDAARLSRTSHGEVTLFPNVSIAAGIF